MKLKSIKQFEDALCNLIKQLCESGQLDIPVLPWTRVIRKDDNKIEFPTEQRLNLTALMIEIYKILEKSHSFERLVKVIREEPSLSSSLLVDAVGHPIPVNDTSIGTWVWNTLLGNFLGTYFANVQQLKFDQEIFDKLFQQVVSDVETTTMSVIHLSPLTNIELSPQEIGVAPGLKLRKLSSDELEQWLNRNWVLYDRPVRTDQLLNLRCAVEVTFQQPRSQPVQDLGSFESLEMLVNALRLMTDRNVRVAFTETKAHTLIGIGGTHWRPSMSPLLPDQVAIINQEEGKRLCDLWNRLQGSTNAFKISLALRRWAGATDRLSYDDRLIDYWIALESLFTPDSNQELRFRSSLRIASFLGETPEERKSIYREMRRSYDRRSEIVHGTNKQALDMSDTMTNTRSYLRRAILKILESDIPFDPNGIEDQLLSR